MSIDYSYHYRKWHSDSTEHREQMATYYSRILAPHLPADPLSAILDVGCGAGFALWTLKKNGYENARGIDSDARQVSACRKLGIEAAESQDTVGFLRECTGKFDLILALDLLEHIPVQHQIEFVSALAGALRQNGRFVCTVPNANSSMSGRYRYIDWTHCCSFTEHSLDFLLHTGGFQEIEISEVEYFARPEHVWFPSAAARHWWVFRFFRFWRRLQMRVEFGKVQAREIPLSPNMIAAAKKR